ncbi:MAG: hypothetical protein LBN95_06470 [Prevotellaceae bacterium]|jgi:hypothetical protein|nr:hypothetical protein [Prevotellaceae bacterium]
MKTIQLNKKNTLELPETWEDLSFKNKIFTFGILSELLANRITPDIARLKMLIQYTGYKPSGWKFFKEAFKKEQTDERETINFNLFRLSEMLNFAFTVDENIITPNHRFTTAPIRYIKIGKESYTGRHFELNITANTDITAREFADCFDLLSCQQKLENEYQKEECVNQIISILFPKFLNYRQNQVSDHIKKVRFLSPEIKFGILFWFMGIVKFYTEHPIYSILFTGNGKKSDSTEKISLGMNEIILSLKKEGFGDAETMTVNDYFDAQIKYLKDNINKAISEGVKKDKLSQSTGISLSVINKLS